MKKITALFFLVTIPILFAQENTSQIIESQGFGIDSLLRGALGMMILLGISIALSTNRKAINWRTVGFGLAAQLLLAISVLKVDFVQKIFKGIGNIFLAVLDFTQKGTEFLFAAFSTGKIDPEIYSLGAVHILEFFLERRSHFFRQVRRS